MVNSAGSKTYPLNQLWSNFMSVDVDHSQDADLISETSLETDEESTPKLSTKEVNAQTLETRRKLEDRLERRRIKNELGLDDYDNIDF